MNRHWRKMPDHETRAIIIATARKLHLGECWHVSRALYDAAFPNSTFEDLDFAVTDRTMFYAIKRISAS
jgi:hypothetical protein